MLKLYWSGFSTILFSAIQNFKRDEMIHGYSCKQYIIEQYKLAFFLALVVLDYMETNHVDYATAYTDLNLSQKIDNLACNNIKWSDVLLTLGINIENGEGINYMELEQTFIIEPQGVQVPINTINFADYNSIRTNCSNLIP